MLRRLLGEFLQPVHDLGCIVFLAKLLVVDGGTTTLPDTCSVPVNCGPLELKTLHRLQMWLRHSH